MQDWTRLLESVLPQPCFDRPFICDGFPSNSYVIVIGENPATEMNVDWWSYWRSEDGFNYQGFLSDYLRQRDHRGKGISNTRRRLDRFRSNGVPCVETNAYQNERPGGAGCGASNHAILDLLVDNMPNLTAVIAHGKIAHELLNKAKIPAGVACYKTRHFRIESYSVIDGICKDIRGALQWSRS